MGRPALAQLLDDVKAGKVDVIVVYKVDRLTRNLADFAKIVEILDEHEASFVSITQSFNTTNSMGRLTLNVLLSFAQFEREVTGERTDPDGKPMSPTQANKGSKCYRYYSTRLKPLEDKASVWHLPAGELEGTVIDVIANSLETELIKITDGASRDQDMIMRYEKAAKELPSLSIIEKRKFLLGQKAAVQVNADTLQIRLYPKELNDPIILPAAAKLVRKGSDLRLAVAPDSGPAKNEPDPVLLRLVAQAFAARDYLIDGVSSGSIAEYSGRHLRNLARLSFLAPDIITAIVRGSQPVSLTGRRLLRSGAIPLDWTEQRALFGFK